MLGNDQLCKVHGIGSIKLRMFDGTCKILTDVRFFPKLKRNLISLGALEAKGYEFKSQGGVLLVLKGSRVIMKGKRNNSLYYLEAKTVIGEVTVVSVQDAKL